jgi:hypothetical protein
MKYAKVFFTLGICYHWAMGYQWESHVGVTSGLKDHKRAIPASFAHPGIVYSLSEVENYRANALSGKSLILVLSLRR